MMQPRQTTVVVIGVTGVVGMQPRQTTAAAAGMVAEAAGMVAGVAGMVGVTGVGRVTGGVGVDMRAGLVVVAVMMQPRQTTVVVIGVTGVAGMQPRQTTAAAAGVVAQPRDPPHHRHPPHHGDPRHNDPPQWWWASTVGSTSDGGWHYNYPRRRG